MDINDILGATGHQKRPETLDFDRIVSITLAMKADMSEAEGDLKEQERRWRARIDNLVDFDSLAYQAIQVGLQLHNIETGADILAMRVIPGRLESYVKTVQAFYDGFILGAEFVQAGGHRNG